MTPTVGMHILAHTVGYSHGFLAQQDTDSDVDLYARGYAPSAESLGQSRMGPSESSATAYVEHVPPSGAKDQYAAWTTERQIPLSKEEIEDIFLDLAQKFGFQRDSMRNMVSLCILCIFFVWHY